MSMQPEQLKNLVVIPTLKKLESIIPFSTEAVDLLMMCSAHESKLGRYIRQTGYEYNDTGGAFGIYQMETATELDIFENFLAYRPQMQAVINEFSGHLMTDYEYSTAMARVHFYRVPQEIPKQTEFNTRDDYLMSLASYCKDHYNTSMGKAEAADYFNDYKELVENGAK